MKYFDSFLNERPENLEDLSYYQGFLTRLEMNIMLYVWLFNCLQINMMFLLKNKKRMVSKKNNKWKVDTIERK